MATYYVNPALASDTGTGTSGDPYGDLAYALTQRSLHASEPTIFVLMSGTAEVLTADLPIYGGAFQRPLIICGSNTVSGDGGKGVINTNGYLAGKYNFSYVYFADIDFVGGGSSVNAIILRDNNLIFRCRFLDYNCSGITSTGGTGPIHVINCSFIGVLSGYSGRTFDCIIGNSWIPGYGRTLTSGCSIGANVFAFNLLYGNGIGHGVAIGNSVKVLGNTFVNFLNGVYCHNSGIGCVVISNIIQSCTTAVGSNNTNGRIDLIHGNLFSNCTNLYSAGVALGLIMNNRVTSSTVLVDPANGDFRLAGDPEIGFPLSWPDTITNGYSFIGAVQPEGGSGRGVEIHSPYSIPGLYL